MARLEIEFATVGQRSLADADKTLNSLNSAYTQYVNELRKASSTSNELERDLINLTNSFKTGAISEAVFKKESQEITNALSSARGAVTQYQAKISSLKGTIDQVTAAQNQAGNSTKKLEGYHKDFQGGIRGSTSIALEFSRVIQDAPYGIQGVANNIQQLSTNFGHLRDRMVAQAAAQGLTVTNWQVLKTAANSLLSPVSLLTIGVSLASAAWVYFANNSQKATKAAKEQEKALRDGKSAIDDYVSGLSRIDRVSAAAAGSYGQEIAKLDTLFNAIQKNTAARYGESTAIQELQRIYPGIFKDLNENIALTDANRKAYDSLKTSIIETAKAQSAMKLGGAAIEDQVKAEKSLADISAKIIGLDNQRLALQQKQAKDANAGQLLAAYELQYSKIQQQRDALIELQSTTNKSLTKAKQDYSEFGKIAAKAFDDAAKNTPKVTGLIFDLQNKIKELNEKQPFITVKSDLDKNIAEVKRLQAELDKLNGKETKTKVTVNTAKGAGENYLDKIANIGKKSDFSAESVGLTGQALDLAKIAEKYKNLNDDILATEKKAINDLKITESEKAAIISAGANRRAELRKNQFEENAGIYEKYAQKEVEAAKSVYDKIAEFENGLGKSKDPVIARLEAQIAKYNELYNAIKKPTEADKLKQFQTVGNLQLKIKQRENEPPDKKQQTILDGTIANFNSGLKRGVSNFTKNFFDSISNISQYADSTFKGATSSIIGNMIGSFSSISLSFVSELLSDKLKAGIKEGTLDLTTKLSAAASIAGGILSGATNKTSTIGQGLGGALGGAGAGAGIGSSFGPQGALIGAGIGAFVGLLGGILGAADARRQEREIQKKQLEEAKKQTDLLRAQAQAWTSAIIGQMSNMGVITGVDRDAFGTPQWKIKGRDLVLATEREMAAQKRGV